MTLDFATGPDGAASFTTQWDEVLGGGDRRRDSGAAEALDTGSALMNHCEHGHARTAGLGGGALKRALAEASERCTRAGERMTSPRLRALELLLAAGRPLKAYDLIDTFGGDGKPAKPPTVYRALDFLSGQGLAHRIESLNAYVACGLGERRHAAAFLICDCCGTTEEVEPFQPEAMRTAIVDAGFVVERVLVEAHGLCAECAAG